jgi:hypothetical protein
MGGARQTKAERKEEARRQRIEIERRMARSRRNRWIVLGVVLVVAAAAALFVVTRPKTAPESTSALLAAAPAAAKAAGCTAVRDVGPYNPQSEDRSHIGVQGGVSTMPPLSSYPSVPPASGPHNPNPFPRGVYASPPPIDQVIHSLEHGAAIVWYAPDASGPALSKIKDFYANAANGQKVIVAPYSYPDQGAAGSLPTGEQMALVSWHHVETCTVPSLAAAFKFTSSYGIPPVANQTYQGDAPEPSTPL